MSLVSLPPRPARAELRSAIVALGQLAKAGLPGADAELRAAEKLARDLYPRKATAQSIAARGGSKGGRRKKRRFIEACDVMVPCKCCKGRGSVAWFVCDKLPSGITCPECAGSGKVVGGTCDFQIADFKQGIGRGRRVKGVWTERFSPVASPMLHRLPSATYRHNRGYALGRVIGRPSVSTIKMRRSFMCYLGGQVEPACTAEDLSAALEGAAIVLGKAQQMPKPHNYKKRGSRRDKHNLTEGQSRRSKMEKRVRHYQAQHNAQVRRESGTHRVRVGASVDSLEILRAMGVDVAALTATLETAPPPVQLDDPTIAEARRRGDLPHLEGPSTRAALDAKKAVLVGIGGDPDSFDPDDVIGDLPIIVGSTNALPNPTVSCKCGCGVEFPMFNDHGKRRWYTDGRCESRNLHRAWNLTYSGQVCEV